MEESPESAPLLEREIPRRRAASWAWPLILFSVAGILLAPSLLPQAEEVSRVEDYAAGMVTMQMQARLIVAVDGFDSNAARKELRKLEALANTDGSAAALAILHVFIDPDDRGPANADRLLEERLSKEGANEEILRKIQAMLRAGATEGQREALRKHLGNFVDYLPAPGNQLTWPNGEELRERAKLTLGVVIGAFGAVLLAGFAGLGVLWFGFYRLANGTLNRNTPVISHHAAPYLLEGFALFMGLFLLAHLGGYLLHWTLQAVFMLGGVAMAVIWPKWRSGLPWKEIRDSLGLHRGRGWLREIGAGMVGYFAVIPLAAIGLIVTMILMFVVQLVGGGGAGEPPSHPAVGLLGDELPTLIFVFVLASVIAPLTEEITFRGAFFGGLRPRWRFLASGLVTALIFAVIHPQGLLAVPPLAAIGFALAGIREWRGSLIAPMVTHGISNGLVFSLAIAVLR